MRFPMQETYFTTAKVLTMSETRVVEGITIGGKYCFILEWDNFKLDDYEHNERSHGSYLYSETTYKWLGKIKVCIGDNLIVEVDVAIEDFSSSENGGVGVEIKSDTPKNVDKELWGQFEQFIQDFIEEKYDRTEWTKCLEL